MSHHEMKGKGFAFTVARLGILNRNLWLDLKHATSLGEFKIISELQLICKEEMKSSE